MSGPEYVRPANFRSNRISENTLMPVSLVIILIGGVFWLTQIYVQGNDNSKAIEKQQIWQQNMDHKMYLIMGALKVKDNGSD